jgi:hypothetical protein
MQVLKNNVGQGQATSKMEQDIAARCDVAFSCGCRLAVITAVCPTDCCYGYEYVTLSPGELPPKGWTIYEQRDGRAVGRSA